MLHPGGLCRVREVPAVHDLEVVPVLPEVGDAEDAVDARDGGGERRRVAEVALHDLDALRRELPRLVGLGMAGERSDGIAARTERTQRRAALATGRPGDEDHA